MTVYSFRKQSLFQLVQLAFFQPLEIDLSLSSPQRRDEHRRACVQGLVARLEAAHIRLVKIPVMWSHALARENVSLSQEKDKMDLGR